MDINISLFSDTFNKIPIGESSILSILAAIKNGRWRNKIEYLRKLDSIEYNQQKRLLQAVTFSGTFLPEREAENLVDYSSFIVLDIDKVNKDDVIPTKLLLSGDPFTFAAFISPSGYGIKVLVMIDSPREYHKSAFLSLENYYKTKYNIKLDASGKDVCRLCYISYDLDLYINQAAQAYNINIDVAPADSVKLKERKFTGKKVSSDVQYVFNVCKMFVERKDQYIDGNKNKYLHHISCTLNRCGVMMDDAVFLLDQNYITPDDKWHQSVKSAYFHNKHEHNSIDVYDLEHSDKSLPPIPEEIVFSGDSIDNNFIKKVVRLLSLGVDTPLLKELMGSYWRETIREGYITEQEKDEKYLNALIHKAFTIFHETINKNKEISIMEVDSMAAAVFSKIKNATYIKTFVPILDDEVLSGGMQVQNVYGLIGMGGTYKSILACAIGCGNCHDGEVGIYFNAEMSDVQFYKRLVAQQLNIDLKKEIEAGMELPEFESIRNKLNLQLRNNLHIVNQVSYSAESMLKSITSFEQNSGKKVKFIVVDGISSMDDCEKDEVRSAIKNSWKLKELAKNANICVMVISHTNSQCKKHIRDAAEYIRGGMKVTANFDGYFSTSLVINKHLTNFTTHDLIYRNDMFYVRYLDKRETGKNLDFVMDVLPLLTLSVSELPAAEFEVELKNERARN